MGVAALRPLVSLVHDAETEMHAVFCFRLVNMPIKRMAGKCDKGDVVNHSPEMRRSLLT
jgi:hypothetical protein